MSEENKAIVRRYLEELANKQNPAIIDELIAPNFVSNSPGFETKGPEEV